VLKKQEVSLDKELTFRQRQVLSYVKKFTSDKGYPPSVREIGKAVGLSSSSTVHAHLSALEERGFIKRDAAKPRALEIRGFESQTNNVSIPVVGRVAAGLPILAEENIDSYFSLPQEFIGNADASFMLEVTGDSMIEAGIFSGDYIVIKKQPTANNGDIVVAMVGDDEATVKRYFHEGNKIRLQPENKNMPPIYSREVKILGKVVAVLRKL
jgi:repressor LexA